jgi:hypothetical protein
LLISSAEIPEALMHCPISGMFVHWQLTEAQGGTFLNAVFGIDPLRRRDRLIDFTVGPAVLEPLACRGKLRA